VAASVARGIAVARATARDAGIARLEEEAASVGAELSGARAASAAVAAEVQRARVLGNSYAERWLRKAEGERAATAAAAASAATQGSATRIAVTESAGAFNEGREEASHEIQAPRSASSLLKVWDATLDRRTCPVCRNADGDIVGVNEHFPAGTPGSVHPFCRCTWQLLTAEENGDRQQVIKPIERPELPLVQVVSPQAPRRATTTVAPPQPAPARRAPRVPAVPHSGYLQELRGNAKRAVAYSRMLSSRVMPEVLRERRMTRGLKLLQEGKVPEAELAFLRTGYRPAITPFDGAADQKAVNDIATGRMAPQGSVKPLPPIRIGISGKVFELIDGRHRLEAAQAAGATEIRARIYQYDREQNVVWQGDRVIPLPKRDPKNPHERR
jgi:hypothetical protein